MEEQKDLPKPELDLPIPRLAEDSAKRAEKEIPEHATPASQGETLRGYGPKWIKLGTLFVILLLIGSSAYFLGNQTSKNQTPAAAPTIAPTPTIAQDQTGNPNLSPGEPKIDQTANWKIFTIPGQYEFKYPLNDYSVKTDISSGTNIGYEWPGKTNVEPNDSYLEKKTGDNSSFSIYATDNKDKLTLNDGARLLGYTKSTLPSGVTQKQVIVGGLKGIRFDNIPNQGYAESDIFIIPNGNKISNNGLIYTIVLSDHSQNVLNANSTAEKMLSAFKFTK